MHPCNLKYLSHLTGFSALQVVAGAGVGRQGLGLLLLRRPGSQDWLGLEFEIDLGKRIERHHGINSKKIIRLKNPFLTNLPL